MSDDIEQATPTIENARTDSAHPSPPAAQSTGTNPVIQTPPTIQSSTPNPMLESLDVLRTKISKNNAFLGVAIGFAALTFTMFLSWANIPAGQRAVDGGESTGWQEQAFWAILPLAFALYPVFLQKAVHLKNLLINVAIAFALLGFNNVLHRSTWAEVDSPSEVMGSALGIGFWIGLLAMIAITVCGVAWSLHTTYSNQKPEAPASNQ